MICIFRVLLLVCFVPNVCADTGTLGTKKQQIAEIQQQKNCQTICHKKLAKRYYKFAETNPTTGTKITTI